MTQAHQSQQALACGTYPPQHAVSDAFVRTSPNPEQWRSQQTRSADPSRRPLMVELECTGNLINELDTVISELEARLQPVLLMLPPIPAGNVSMSGPAGIAPVSSCPANTMVVTHHEMLRSLNRRLVAISERVVA